MKVVFRQSGGFAGLIRAVELDTDDLPPEEAAELYSLVQQSDLQNTRGESESRWRDLQTYEIRVETGEDVYEVAFDDSNVPAGVTPLLAFLRKRSKPLPLS